MSLDSPQDLPRPEPPSTPAIEAFCQYLKLLELGQEVDWGAYRDEHAELAVELERLLAEYERVTAILDSLAPAASFSARLREHYGESVDPGISLSGDGGARRPASSSEAGSSGEASSARVLKRLSAQSPEMRRYEARREIARGGMGAILEVWDSELRRTLAMKVVLTGRDSKDADDSEGRVERRLSRFLEEAQITGQLDHPGIVPVHDIGIDDQGRVFFTMQLVDGLDLRKVFELSRLERDGWTQRRVVGVLIRVCEAMAYAHSKGVVHRDLKPANIMVGRFGEAFVMDWGLAKVVGRKEPARAAGSGEGGAEGTASVKSAGVETDRSDSDTGTDSALKTLDGDVVGTPAYMAPEQARGKLDEIGPRSDVYAVGAMLYHLLSGHMPFEPLGEKVAAHTILEAVRKGPPWPLQQLNPEVDGELAAICAKAMERDPDQRYAEVMALGEDLRAWVEGRGVDAYTSGVLYETRKWMERNKATTGALLAMIGLALVSVLLFIWQQQVSVTSLEREKEATRKEALERAAAEAELQQSVQELRENEQELKLEAARAERAREEAMDQEILSRKASEQATLNAEKARKSERKAVRSAYRSHINAAAYSLRLSAIDEARAHLDQCAPSLRGWEWHHLRLATDSSVGESIVQERGLSELAVSPDGTRLLSYGFGLPARVWDTRTRRMLIELEAVASITPFTVGSLRADLSCAFGPRGDLVVLSDPSTPYAQLFSVPTGSAILSYKPRDEGEGQVISGVEVSADGNWVVTISRQGYARVHALSGGEEAQSFRYTTAGRGATREPGVLTALALDNSGELIVAGAQDGQTVVWDLATGEEFLRLGGNHTGAIQDVEVSPDQRRILTASKDGSLGVWDAHTGALLAMMRGHVGGVNAARFSDDGKLIVSAGEDLTLRVWDAASGRQRRVLHGHDQAVQALASLHDGRHMASASLDRTVRIWDLGWDPSLSRLQEGRTVVSFSFLPDGREVYATTERGRLYELDLDTGRARSLLEDGGGPFGSGASYYSARLSPDGRYLALALGDRSLEVRDVKSGEVLRRIESLDRVARFLVFSADSRYLLAAGEGREARVLDLEGDLPDVRIGRDRKPAGIQRALRGADLSPDGTRVATVDRDGDLRIWNARTGAFVSSRRDIHKASVTAVAYAPGGQLLATGSKDRSVKLWRIDDMTLEHELRGHGSAVECLAFSPDGTRLVSGGGGGEVRLWSVEAGEGMVELVGGLAGGGAVLDLEFSPDGSRLAASGVSMGVRVWESDAVSERYAHRERDVLLAADAESMVRQLFRSLLSPELVETAIRADAGLSEELRERAREVLAARRDDVEYCEAIVAPLLISGEAKTQEYRRMASWLEGLGAHAGHDPSLLGWLAASEVRMGEAQRAERSFEELHALDAGGCRDVLFEGLARAMQGDSDSARELLSEARGELQNISRGDRRLLAPLTRELELRIEQNGDD